MGPKVIKVAYEFASFYLPFIYIPAIVILLGITLYSKKHYPDVFRRIVIGLGVGVLSTVALDFFRQMGVINGWLPADTAAMFGKMATASRDFSVFYPIGVFIHFMNGANFGLVYTFIWGKQKNYWWAVFWAVLWLNLIELGMMLGPPMGPMLGLFGVNYAWPQLFLLTYVAHIAFGITLGILAQFFLKEEDHGWLFPFFMGEQTVL